MDMDGSCKVDSDCTHERHLCCESYCMTWTNCKDSCKDRTNCKSQNQICYRHRCIEDSLTYGYCLEDSDCFKANDKGFQCKESRCISDHITTERPQNSQQVAWIRALFISGLVALSLLACGVVYCYRKRYCTASSVTGTRPLYRQTPTCTSDDRVGQDIAEDTVWI